MRDGNRALSYVLAMLRIAVPVALVLACSGPAMADPTALNLGPEISLQGLGGLAPGKPLDDRQRHDFSEKKEFAYRFPSARGTGPDWLRPQGDGTVCFDLDMAYGDCDLKLRGDTLLLMQIDEGKRFRFNFELGVKP